MSSKKNKLLREFEMDLAEVPLDENFEIEPLKRPSRFGAYLWWPAENDDWVHPDDVELARQLIPSERVFRREDIEGDYSLLTYDDLSIRVKPTMWLEIEPEGFEIGDYVETKSQFGKKQPLVAMIKEIYWDRQKRRIEYVLTQEGRNLKKRVIASEMQMIKSINGHLTARQLLMAEKNRIR